MYVTKHIDWLSITLPTGTDMERLFPLLDWHYIGRGMHGYKYRYKDALTGTTFQTDGPVDDMGVHVVFDGEALSMLRSSFGGTDDGLCRLTSERHGYSSRIDLTLNIHQSQLTPRKVYQAFKAGNLTAKSKRGRFIEGINGDVSGDTFYMGSPKSDRQFRAYNKSAELGIVDGEAWLRLELELRNLRANSAYQSCVGNGVAAVVTGHMEDFLGWNNHEYRQAVSSNAVPPTELPRKQTNRQKWLLGQVAQALAKEIAEDVQFRDKFDAAVDGFLDPLQWRE